MDREKVIKELTEMKDEWLYPAEARYYPKKEALQTAIAILTALGEEKYCECGHIFTPGKCIEVDKVAPPTCAKCHRVIRILDFTPPNLR